MYIMLSILIVAMCGAIYFVQRNKQKRNKAVYTYSALPLALAFVFETWHYVVLALVGVIVVVSVISIAVRAAKNKKKGTHYSERSESVQQLEPEHTKAEFIQQEPQQQAQPVAQPVVQEVPTVQHSETVVQESTVVTTSTEVEQQEQPKRKIDPLAEKISKPLNGSDDTLIRYNKSFTAKIVLGDEELRDRYNEIKNFILSFEGVKARMSWSNETFRYKRQPVAKLAIRGKSITMYVALNPQQFEDSPYNVDDCSGVKRYVDFPSAVKLKGPRVTNFAKTMVTTRLEQLDTYSMAMYEPQDFRLPYRPFTTLLQERLIKEVIVHKGTSGIKRLAGVGELILQRVEAEEADELMEDEVAATLVETRHLGIAATGKKGIINIGDLTKVYKDGDTVTLDDLKAKKMVQRDVERLKVLADGYLDKRLTVEAQDFSLDAVKMILLTGGKVVEVD